MPCECQCANGLEEPDAGGVLIKTPAAKNLRQLWLFFR
jgi:hypothetical protein